MSRDFLGWLTRHVLYVAIMLAVFGAVWIDSRGGDMPNPPMDRQGHEIPETYAARMQRMGQVTQFREGGMIESMELATLVALALAGLWIGLRHPDVRTVAFLFGGLMGLLVIREQDKWFDTFIHGAWIFPELLLAAGMAFYALRRWRQLKTGLVEFVRTPIWGFFASGCLVTLVFSRLMGRSTLWKHVITEPFLMRNVKNLVEEGLETAGYALMLCALIEAMAYLHRARPAAK